MYLMEDSCSEKYMKLFHELEIGEYAKLDQTYGDDKDYFAAAGYIVDYRYVKPFIEKVTKRNSSDLKLKISDYSDMNKNMLDEGTKFIFVEVVKEEQDVERSTAQVDTSTLQKFITLTKRLNKQLFFKDSNGNLKRIVPSKYDSIKPEHLANIFVTKTGKEEMSLASIIPQLKQDNLIEQIEKLYEENINMNNLIEDRKDEQPSDMITVRRYRPIPLSYRDKLQELGFKSAGRAGKWFKEYKGYCIAVVERTNRQKLAVLVLERSILRTDPTRGKELLAVEVYTEEQMVGKIKELESKIDTFRKDPYDRGVESIYEQMNRIDDEESLIEGVSNTTKILNYTKNNLDRFNEYDSYEEWLDELNIDGVFDIPAKYCDDFENVTDEEAEAYIKMILSQGKLKQQLDDLKQ